MSAGRAKLRAKFHHHQETTLEHRGASLESNILNDIINLENHLCDLGRQPELLRLAVEGLDDLHSPI